MRVTEAPRFLGGFALCHYYQDIAGLQDRISVRQQRASSAAARCLMQIFAALGDRSAAAHQYRVCVEALAAELGVAPEPARTALHEALMQGKAISWDGS